MNGTKRGAEAAGSERREARGERREQSSNSREIAMSTFHYRDLLVWQKAMDLAVQCYEVTRTFPAEERYGLTSQIRRAVVSVPSNIAEGQTRFHTKEFLNHLSIARGSLAEMETELMIGQRVGFLTEERLQPLLALSDEIGRMTAGLRQSLEAKLS